MGGVEEEPYAKSLAYRSCVDITINTPAKAAKIESRTI